MAKTFKLVVLSSEKRSSDGPETLPFVNKCWNHVANTTPNSWTKIILTTPFSTNKFNTTGGEKVRGTRGKHAEEYGRRVNLDEGSQPSLLKSTSCPEVGSPPSLSAQHEPPPLAL
jgi:hypothetical protein